MSVGPPASAAVPLGGAPPEPSAALVRAAASDGEFDDASSSFAVCDAQPPGEAEAPSRTGADGGMA